MRSMTRMTLGIVALAVVLSATAAMAATPTVNSAVLIPRVWNDCPFSTLTTGNTYPSQIFFNDSKGDCGAWANLHVWRLSNGGATPALFPNASDFRIAADLVISGVNNAEAGLQIRPWWSEADGRFNVRTPDGEIACFGGRLPFFSFTGTFGLHYVKGTSIHLEAIYHANGLSMVSPATIEYRVNYGGSYTSGALPFDEGNPAEPYGTWGILNNAQVGGYAQVFLGGLPNEAVRAEWTNLEFADVTPPPAACCHAGWINGQQGWCSLTALYECQSPHVWHPEWSSCEPNPCPVIPTVQTSWGRIKNDYRN
jgi:hypothetical protein